jgi:hypothetical protein
MALSLTMPIASAGRFARTALEQVKDMRSLRPLWTA